MASLISPEIFAQAYLQRAMPNLSRPQPVGHVQYHAPQQPDPLYFNMADEDQPWQGQGPFMSAQRQRLQGSATAPVRARAEGPMANHVFNTAMMQAAGLSDEEKEKYKNLHPDQLKEVLSLRHQVNSARQAKTPSVTAADFQQSAAAPQMAGLNDGQMSIQGQGQPRQTFQGTPGTQQGVHPAAQMLQALGQQGIPPQQLEAYKQHLLAGGTTQQVMSHAQQFLHQQQAAQHQQISQQQSGQHQQLTALQEQEKNLMQRAEKALDPHEQQMIEKDLTLTRQNLMGLRGQMQQGQQAPQAPQPQMAQQATQQPQGGGRGGNKPQRPLTHEIALQFYQQAGGDPNKARGLAAAEGYH